MPGAPGCTAGEREAKPTPSLEVAQPATSAASSKLKTIPLMMPRRDRRAARLRALPACGLAHGRDVLRLDLVDHADLVRLAERILVLAEIFLRQRIDVRVRA